MIYHLRKGDRARPTAIEPILFLSKCLTPAECRYWPTELEMAGVVWTIKKVHHMIRTSRLTTIIWTDHSSIPHIADQTKLSSTNVDKLNLRLIRASTYISQFNIAIKHKAGREHIIPDTLSRLPSTLNRALKTVTQTTEVHAYAGTTVELSEAFKERILEAYKTQKWAVIWTELDQARHALSARHADKNHLTKNKQGPPLHHLDKKGKIHGASFQMRRQLIFHVDASTGKARLCIPKAIMGEVFKIAHDNAFHMGYHRTFNAIVEGLYIRRLAHHLKKYIDCCPQCRLNRTTRHAPYGSMVAITSPALPFHTICMDFIVALLTSGTARYNSILTVTDKFSKAKLLIPGRDDMSAKDWAVQLLDYLRLCNWGIPNATISDRDPKFRSELWRELFRSLGVDLLVSTSYHPQTDGLSEQTNQSVEIALQYLISFNPNTDWHESLPALQLAFMNSQSTATGASPNEILYGHMTRDELNVLDLNTGSIARDDQQVLFRREAADALDFANARAKLRYDRSHTHLEFKVGDKAYLRLHRGYALPDMPNKKLSNQRAGPFEIIQRVSELAYKLKLPAVMRIYPVVLIAQLEPAETDDLFDRKRPDHPGPVEMEGAEATDSKSKEAHNGTQSEEVYEVEQILDKRLRKYGKSRPRTEYRVKWVG